LPSSAKEGNAVGATAAMPAAARKLLREDASDVVEAVLDKNAVWRHAATRATAATAAIDLRTVRRRVDWRTGIAEVITIDFYNKVR